MIIIDKTVISEDLTDNFFLCNLDKCKGGCCVEGDLGAPLEKDELKELEEIYEEVKPFLTEAGKLAIADQGKYIFDEDREYSTPTINGKECAYAVYNEKGILKCGIEQAWQEGKISFRKPISCHLYPIRVTKYDSYDALNYDRWEICLPACELGKKARVPLYKFVKEALIRKYGKIWYEKLVETIKLQDIKIAEK